MRKVAGSEARVISSRNEVTVGSLQSAVSWHASFPGTAARRGLFINKAHSERRGAAAMLDRQLPHQNPCQCDRGRQLAAGRDCLGACRSSLHLLWRVTQWHLLGFARMTRTILTHLNVRNDSTKSIIFWLTLEVLPGFFDSFKNPSMWKIEKGNYFLITAVKTIRLSVL